jgi:cell division septation protein DedD
MARNDEGEFELVLGNRQLLSGFFIVVILFGVFFTMGYIVGRHSSPAPLNAANASASESTPPRAVSPAAPPPGQAEVMPAEPAKTDTPSAPPSETSEPVTATRPATAPPESPRPPEPKPVSTTTNSADLTKPEPGSYLQVAAPKRTAAEAVVESLKNKGIAAVLAPGPDEETVRVLVGPLDASSIGKMRADLESAGFKPFAKRY